MPRYMRIAKNGSQQVVDKVNSKKDKQKFIGAFPEATEWGFTVYDNTKQCQRAHQYKDKKGRRGYLPLYKYIFFTEKGHAEAFLAKVSWKGVNVEKVSIVHEQGDYFMVQGNSENWDKFIQSIPKSEKLISRAGAGESRAKFNILADPSQEPTLHPSAFFTKKKGVSDVSDVMDQRKYPL